MDLQRVLAQLRSELEHLDAAIKDLERLQSAHRRGRPPSLQGGASKGVPRRSSRKLGKSDNRPPSRKKPE